MDIKPHHKLVRDLVPWCIDHNGNGEHAITHIACSDELWRLSLQKLQEEVDEFLKDSRDAGELGDVLAVVELIAQQLGLSWQQLIILKNKKEEERGGFKMHIVLDEVHSGLP